MVTEQIVRRGVRDPRVLAAMRSVPREEFVAPALARVAYHDRPLPIEEGQTISQPFIVAVMTEALDVDETDRVLEVGAGSGYAAAVLGLLAAEVHTIERHPRLARIAGERLARLGFTNVRVHTGDGTLGLPEHAPFDGIIVAAGGPDVPRNLLAQLAEGGRLVIPVGPPHAQSLLRITRRGGEYTTENLGAVAFVPLVGKEGWAES